MSKRLLALAAFVIAAFPAAAGAADPIKFDSKEAYESFWAVNVDYPVLVMEQNLSDSGSIPAAEMTSYYDGLIAKAKTDFSIDLRFPKGLVPFAQEMIDKLLSRVSAADEKTAIQQNMILCKQHLDIFAKWKEVIALKKSLNDEHAKTSLEWADLGEFAGPILIPFSHPDVGGLQPESAITLMQMLTIGSPNVDFGIQHVCTLAAMGTLISSGVASESEDSYIWHPVDIPDEACKRYRFETPKDPANVKSCVRIMYQFKAPAPSGFTGIKNQNDGWIKFADTYLKRLQPQVDQASASAAAREAENVRVRGKAKIGSTVSLPLPLSNISATSLVARVVNGLLGTMGALAMLMFVYGGVSWMLARGDTKRLSKSKAILIWSTLGLIAIFSAYAVISLVTGSLTG